MLVTEVTTYSRGQSQTEGDSALFNGPELDAGKGIHAGVWASEAPMLAVMLTEKLIHVGWAGAIRNDISPDVGYIHYAYSGDGSLDGSEVIFRFHTKT